MSEEKYVFFIGVEAFTTKGFRLIVKFAWHSPDVIRRYGTMRLLEVVRREIPEVKLFEFEHATSNLADLTLEGKKAKGGEDAAVAFGREVTRKLDAIVTHIVD